MPTAFAQPDDSRPVAGPGGPLAEYGLVPDPELATVQAAVADETVLTAAN